MRRSQYDLDSEALDAIYQAALVALAAGRDMDDDARSHLVTVVVKSYFAALDAGGAHDLKDLIEAVIADYEALSPMHVRPPFDEQSRRSRR